MDRQPLLLFVVVAGALLVALQRALLQVLRAQPVLHLVQDTLRQRVKHLVHVLARQRTGLQEQDVLLLRKPTGFQEGHLPLLLEVALVSNCDDRDVVEGGLLARVGEPGGEVVVRLTRCHVVQDECANRTAVVGARDGAIPGV